MVLIPNDKGFAYSFDFGFVWLQGDLRNRDDLEKLFSETKYVYLDLVTSLVFIICGSL